MIRQIEQADGPVALHCGSLANPIRMMEHEHDNAGAALAKFRTLTDDFTPPHWACNTFRARYDALDQLEADMHQHVHKENNVLFPKALQREAAAMQAQA
jgi:regulator of cell morphogenesis and NO signaling